MSSRPRICAYYSVCLNYDQILRHMRAREPHAHITALLPAGYVASEAERGMVNDIVHSERRHYAPWQPLACLRLVRLIRSGHYDRFAVMFPTAQLRILASLGGSPHCECWAVDNRIYPLDTTPSNVILGIGRRYVRGSIEMVTLLLRAVAATLTRRGPR